MKKVIVFLFFIFISGSKETIEKAPWEKIELAKEKTYLVFRGTNTKQGDIARDFNLSDRKSSHVGLAVFDSEEWRITHIVNTDNPTSDLKSDTFASFLHQGTEKVFYTSIWEIDNLNQNEQKNLRLSLKKYHKKQFKFDRWFMVKDDHQLYCSELIQKILTEINPDKFKFELHKKKLKSFYATFLRRDTLSYYPVDIFQKHKYFKLVKEWDLTLN